MHRHLFLGISLCKAFREMHHKKVWVRAKAQRSCFRGIPRMEDSCVCWGSCVKMGWGSPQKPQLSFLEVAIAPVLQEGGNLLSINGFWKCPLESFAERNIGSQQKSVQRTYFQWNNFSFIANKCYAHMLSVTGLFIQFLYLPISSDSVWWTTIKQLKPATK